MMGLLFMEIVMEEKYYWFMICYIWQSNGKSGNGSYVLSNDSTEILNRDIASAIDAIKEFSGKQVNHDKDSMKIIITNIINLAHCTVDEFYKKDDAE